MKLQNTFFIMRHGQSEANVAGLLTSDPAVCTKKYGLTDHGKEQVATSIQNAKQKGLVNDKTIIYCSDFLRTRETAEIVRKMLRAKKIQPNPALRERNFGTLHGTFESTYQELWPLNKQQKDDQERKGIESVASIQSRFIAFIKELDTKHQGKCILLISHGDPLQALQAAFAGTGPEQSRKLNYIQQAEIRELTLNYR